MEKKLLFIMVIVANLLAFVPSWGQTTSWTGAVSTSWADVANWTGGVPNATLDAVLGDNNFTGANQPLLNVSSTCKSLIIGGAVPTTLSLNQRLTVEGDVIIHANGALIHNKSAFTILGNWNNSGSYTPTHNRSRVTFAGVAQLITGTSVTAFRRVNINTGSTVTLNQNCTVGGQGNSGLTVDGTLLPGTAPTYQVGGSGTLTLGATGYLQVIGVNFTDNYAMMGSKNIAAGSTIAYTSAATNQVVSNLLTYSTLIISGGTTKTLAGNLPALSSSSTVTGNIEVLAGILDLSSFTANRGGSTPGGILSVAAGATLKIGGTTTLPINYASYNFDVNSNVEYSGTNQTVTAKTYGNLILSSASGAAVKTLPSSSFTVSGNFSTIVGSGSSVACTAFASINFAGFVSIGSGTSFNGGNFTHTVEGNWTNNGVFNGNTGTITMAGTSRQISGSGTHNFNNLTASGPGVFAAAITLTLTGNLATTGVGTFSQLSGGTVVMSGTAKNITGTGINLNDLQVTGSISSPAIVTVLGNVTVNASGSFTGTGGSIVMAGLAKTIASAGTLSFYNLTVSGSISTASNFIISSVLDVTGTFTASAGTITFTGTSTFTGQANLYNVTINGTSLRLATNSVLGIANVYTIAAGTLDVTSDVPNTVNFNGVTSKTIASGTFHHLIFTGNTNTAGGSITVNGALTIQPSTVFNGSSFTHTVKGNWVNNGTFNAATGTVEFAGTSSAAISGNTTFNSLSINKSSVNTAVNLLDDVTASVVNMTQGRVNTGNNILAITTDRTGPGIIIGSIRRLHAFSTGIAYAFEGPQNTITFSSVSGVTSILLKVATGAGAITDFPFSGSVNRLYDISVPAGTYNATLRLHYEDVELNGNAEAAMKLWRYNNVWLASGKTGNNTSLNYVEQTGLTDIATRWTFSDDNNVIGWNGSVSSDWANSANWTWVQGSPAAIPSVDDVVQIGFGTYTFAPVISTAATAKSITFGSAVNASLTFASGGSLTVEGNISGIWSGNATHTVFINGQTMNIVGDLVLSDGSAGHDIDLNIGTGTVNVSGSVTQSGGADIIFAGAGLLNIGTDFYYSNGTFTGGPGTVTYNGVASQSIAAVPYHTSSSTKQAPPPLTRQPP